MKFKSKYLFLSLMLFLIILIFSDYSYSNDECTLAGVSGYFVKGGGTIVFKNRDRNTRFIQTIDYVTENVKYSFLGVGNIDLVSKKDLAYTMGINEKGLICVSSSAPSKINYDFKNKKVKIYHPGKILADIATVDEFINEILKKGKLTGPMNYIVADSKKMCIVEVIYETNYDYKIIVNGKITHTNHYYFENNLKYQPIPINESSFIRLNRINEILNNFSYPITINDFINISKDHGINNSYNDNNLCRHPDMVYGDKKFDGGTISAMILESKPNHPPRALIALGQPCIAPFEEFIISNGKCFINPIKNYFYKSGLWNIYFDFIRDSYYHFIIPFTYNINL